MSSIKYKSPPPLTAKLVSDHNRHMKQIAVTLLALAGLCALSCNGDAAAPPSSSEPGTTTDAPDVPSADYVPPSPDEGRVQDGEGDSQGRITPPDSNTDATPEEDTAPVEDTLEPAADCNSEPGGAGCPCSTSDQCDSAACILTSQGKVCADFCVNSCPEGWSCQAITPPGTEP